MGEFAEYRGGAFLLPMMTGIVVPVFFLLMRNAVRRLSGQKKRVWVLILPFAFLLGVFLCRKALAVSETEAWIRENGAEESAVLTGTVSKIQERKDGYRIWLSDAVAAVSKGEEEAGTVLIKTETEDLPCIGNEIRAEGSLQCFDQTDNPGAFDLCDYYRSLGCVFYMKTETITVLRDTRSQPKDWLYHLRCALGKVLEETAGEDAGILRAVFLGEGQLVDEETRDLYQSQGIAHVLSVSGLHLSFAGLFVYRLIRRLTGSYPVGGLVGGTVLLLYGLLLDSPVAVMRASVMLIFRMTADIRGRVYDPATALAAAAILIGTAYPLAFSQAAFQLSFAAVAGISLIAEAWDSFLLKPEKKSSGNLPMQTNMLPVLYYWYYRYPVYSIFVNAMILPFSAALIGLSACTAAVGSISIQAGKIPAWAAHLILTYYEKICTGFSDFPLNGIVNGRPAGWRLILWGTLAAGLVLGGLWYRQHKKKKYDAEAVPRGWKKRRRIVRLASLAAFVFSVFFLKCDPVSVLTVTMLDVGQGDSFLIEIPGGINILTDGGSTSQSNTAEYVLEPALFSKGIAKLDGLILTHADEDHINGAEELLARGKAGVDFIALPEYNGNVEDFSEILQSAQEENIEVRFLKREDVLTAGEAELRFFNPSQTSSSSLNNTSLVYLLTYGSFRMLFTGDITSEMEGIFGEKIDVLKVPHHGSKYSTSAEWLETLAPAVSLISCSENNSYGHPHEELLERLKEAGSRICITAQTGSVCVFSDGRYFYIEE